MNFPRRSGLLRVSVALGTVMALAACGAGDPGDESNGGDAETTVNMGIPTDVNFSRVMTFTAENQPLRATLFDYLIDKSADGTYSPALAKSWEWSEDQTELTLTLRDDVTYHSGRDFGPDDVVATIETALAEGSGVQVANVLRRASGVSATGDSEVTVTFDEPFYGYLDALAVLPIIDIETIDEVESGREVIGTGPYKLVSYTPGSGLELERYEDYWAEGKPAIDHISMQIITDSSAMLAAIRSGDIDIAQRMLPRDAAALEDEGDFNVDHTVGFDVYVGANVAVPPLDDVRVRQAIAYSLDRERIAEQVYSGFAEPSSIPWASTTPGVSQEQVNHYSYDIDKAKSLLEEAGAMGATVTLSAAPIDPAYGAIGEIVHYGLEQAGFTVETASFDVADRLERLQTGTMPGIWVSPVGLTAMSPTTALLTALPLKAGKNSSNVEDSEYVDLVGAMTSATSEDELAAATTALTDYMLAQAFHNTVVQAQTPFVSVPELTGVTSDLTLAVDFTDATME